MILIVKSNIRWSINESSGVEWQNIELSNKYEFLTIITVFWKKMSQFNLHTVFGVKLIPEDTNEFINNRKKSILPGPQMYLSAYHFTPYEVLLVLIASAVTCTIFE